MGEGTPKRLRADAPSRRKVLAVAGTAAAGVAATRLLGLRDLSDRAFSSALGRTAAMALEMAEPEMAMDPEMAIDPAMAMDSAMDAEMSAPKPAPLAEPSSTPASSATPRPAPAAPRPTAAPVKPEPAVAPRTLSLDWVPPFATEAGRVAHLLRRTTFAPTRAELERAQSEGYARTLDRLLETPPAAPRVLTDADARNIGTLQTWWLEHMIQSPTPFAEAMTLFWHGHFTSDFRKVGTGQPYLYWQNLTWRNLGTGDLRTLVKQATIDPAMLRYLDLGISTGRNPNENYARELMELFTMGAGTFTEDDVKAASRALAGWRLPRANEEVRTGVFERARAYAGQVTFLGKTGTLDTDGVIDRILANEATAPYVVRALWTHFVSPSPNASAVALLASRFKGSGYQIKPLLRDLFTLAEFTSPGSYRALVKSPTELMVGLARLLGASTLARPINAAADGMGQRLFDPPNVSGWPQNAGWVSANSMIARANFVSAALGQVRDLPLADDAYLRALDGVVGPSTASILDRTTGTRDKWMAILSSPEFQLK
ncbi:MAG: DUF1800 domain-containing protein [Chloroflexi bacterium]|nr:DUF1800 domain-containing protein [Chloroflexota bacterium]